ncbi:MAG: outer membrane lipoprotein-sorting protein, partial [Bdellovibrionales bacterium]|nr:outer membrane lipoprotein-sorting protein [Bdellovibrionales bacterium]
QSWMGSDFSYQDLSRDDELLEQYTHMLVGEEQQEGQTVFLIESRPLEDAPVVWGKELLRIRQDNIILLHEFYDQDMKLVKRLVAKEIGPLGGKLFPKVLRMENAEAPSEWTELVHEEAQFDGALPDSLFTLSNLRNPRRL